MTKIKVRIGNEVVVCDKYSKVGSVLIPRSEEKTDGYLANPIVGATVDGEMKSLMHSVYADAQVEPIYAFESLGRRIYRHSICFLLSYASFLAYPERHLIIGHSLGDGFYFSYDDDRSMTEEEVDTIRE
ncbi:MAG: hypothetical protein ACI4S4_07745, partial [Candidatus Ornithospirochaeta sp.]